jgi:hypothetical protein
MNNFDTTRFIETSTPRQIENGTVMFMDTKNPGVYYTANRNGNINRVIKTTERNITIGKNTTTTTTTKNCTRYTRVNYRHGYNGDFEPIYRLNDQLRRIQEVADNVGPATAFSIQENDNTKTLITPR